MKTALSVAEKELLRLQYDFGGSMAEEPEVSFPTAIAFAREANCSNENDKIETVHT